MNCKTCQSVLPDLLLEPSQPEAAVPGSIDLKNAATAAKRNEARAHMAGCAECAQELASLQATFALLDTWNAPEVSPYFEQKLAVRLREEQAAPAAGWLEKLRDYLQLNTGRQFRPAVAGALAFALIVGGGSFGVSTYSHPVRVQASATVNDLQILDKNEQALQQMDQLLDDEPDAGNPAAPPQS